MQRLQQVRHLTYTNSSRPSAYDINHPYRSPTTPQDTPSHWPSMFNTSLRRVARSCPPPSHLSSIRPSPSSSTISAASFTTHSHQRRNSSSKPPIPPNNGHPPIPAGSVKQVGAPRSRPGAESRLSKKNGSGKGSTAKGDKEGKIVDVNVKAKADKEKEKIVEDYSNEWTRSLPAVPSTQHLNPKDVYVASFFSTHRPISITGPLPPETSTSDIDKIFAIRPQRSQQSQRKTQDVIYTLSNAVNNLDGQIEQQTQQGQQDQTEAVTQRADIIKALTQHNTANQQSSTSQNDGNTHHLDGQPGVNGQMRVGGNVKLVIQALARQFRPFNPPPAPTAAPEVEFFAPEKQSKEDQSAEQAQAAALETEIVQQDVHTLLNSAIQQPTPASTTEAQQQTATKTQPQTQTQTATDTTSSSRTANTFFTPSFHPTSSHRTRRGMLLLRHLSASPSISLTRNPSGTTMRIPSMERVKMYLISVKRQRRLKMKKHKYKKLQRKTRNLRRRQGKI